MDLSADRVETLTLRYRNLELGTARQTKNMTTMTKTFFQHLKGKTPTFNLFVPSLIFSIKIVNVAPRKLLIFWHLYIKVIDLDKSHGNWTTNFFTIFQETEIFRETESCTSFKFFRTLLLTLQFILLKLTNISAEIKGFAHQKFTLLTKTYRYFSPYKHKWL